MSKIKFFSVVMPVYNEEQSIKAVIHEHIRVLQELQDKIEKWEIVCLDDHSTDSTLSIMSELSTNIPELRILKNEHNLGIAKSFQKVIHEAKGQYIYFTGSDGQWPAENMSKMLQTIVEHQADLVIGVRSNKKHIYGFKRRFISWVLNFLPELTFRVKTADANSVMIGTREVFQLPLISKSLFMQAERIILAIYGGFRITYVPINFRKRRTGKETGVNFKNVRGSFWDFIRCFIYYKLLKNSARSK